MRLLFFLLFPISLSAQFTYTVDQSIPVDMNGTPLINAWAGGLNSSQFNTMDLNADGLIDIVIFDKTSSKINTYVLQKDNSYKYAPEYEIFFPSDVNTFMVLRDYNCDGKKDLFTFGQIGVFVYQNVTQGNNPPTWKKLTFYNPDSGLRSDVLLTRGFSMTNLLPGTNDLPNFTDIDGDGDLDVINMKFVSPSQAEYHKNFSMELYGRCDSLTLIRQTQSWGNFLECSCGKIAFGSQTCADIGGRVDQTQHTGGKALLTYDFDNDGDKDLLFSEETCPQIYYLENKGDAVNANMTNWTLFPSTNPINFPLFPATYLEDVDQDGKLDLLASPNISSHSGLDNDFSKSLWFYKNTGTNQLPVFTFVKTNFLQETMIDIGDSSSPAFTDIDSDGDLDMFIGKYSGVNAAASIHFYENTGGSKNPSFKFITDDYLGISLLAVYNLKPQFFDVDRNGGIDLVFTATSLISGVTSYYYVLSSSNKNSSFNGQTVKKFILTLDFNENVTMTDVDGDGPPDLLIGTSTGALEYWRNSGSGNTFSLADNSFLGLSESIFRQNVAVSIGDLDGDGKNDLVMGDQLGRLSIFSNFSNAGSTAQAMTNLIYDSFSKTYGSKNLGGKLRTAVANLFGTDKPALAIGNTLGGIQILKNDSGLILADAPQVSIFPNPLPIGKELSVMSDRSAVMEVYTVLGQRIGTSLAISGNEIITYPLQGIAAGIYIARFTSGSKSTALRFIIQ